MKKRQIVWLFFLLATLALQAQTVSVPQRQTADTVRQNASRDVIQQKTDSIIAAEGKIDTLAIGKKDFKPNPKMAVILAASFPGLGQVYNRKYWKLPILYGGFIGFSYAISWNNKYYQLYFDGYKSLIDGDPKTNEWHNVVPYGQDPATIDQTWFADVLKRRKDFYRRFRDLSIIGTVALYGLSIVDAYVDAQLFDFDISTDLSMRVEPAFIMRSNNFTGNALGIQCSLNF